MRHTVIVVLVLLVTLSVTSCTRRPDKNRKPLARVYNTYLYADELKGLMPESMNENDSIEILNHFVNTWIEKQLILEDAGRNLTAREKDFSYKIREYRNALLIFEWEKKILAEKLDTLITDLQIREYYEANQQEFILQADIVRVLYIKLNANSVFRNDAYNLLSTQPFNKNRAEQFCRKYAVNYFLDVKSWLYVEDILKEIPINPQQKQELSTGNAFVEMKDDEHLYLMKVLEVKLKGSVSPLALEESTIKEIILQKRKSELIELYTRELRSKAERNANIEKFSNN